MKKSMSKLLLIAMFFLSFSCNKKSEIEDIFISRQNEYWKYIDDCQSHGIYFRFNEKGTFDKYNRFIKDGFNLFNNDGDLISEPRSWSIRNDTTFVWNKEIYKIESCDEQKIILTYNQYKDKKCKVILQKVLDK